MTPCVTVGSQSQTELKPLHACTNARSDGVTQKVGATVPARKVLVIHMCIIYAVVVGYVPSVGIMRTKAIWNPRIGGIASNQGLWERFLRQRENFIIMGKK